jgi:uncharacterized protein YndB with AHSA1/START domain
LTPAAEPLEVSNEIAAPPEVVWRLISDLTRMGEWSPECTKVTWQGGATGPSVGARFKGHNRNGIRRWSTQGRIVAAEVPTEIAWDISALGLAGSRWGYRIEALPDGGSRVTESWLDRRGKLLEVVGKLATGVPDRAAGNAASMKTTLKRLKQAAEAQSPLR